MTADLVLETGDGAITITAAALTQVVQTAVDRVEGSRVRRRRRGIEIELDDGRARVQVELAVRYGVVVPAVASAVQEEVSRAVTESCGVTVEAVDVAIEEVDDP